MATITDLINNYIATGREILLQDFMIELQNKFYPNQEIEFMTYFFELTKQEYKGKFVVPHTKLIEYGIATSDRSNNMLNRLIKLGFVEGEDFQLQEGAINEPNMYMLMPETFKLALMRAKKLSNNLIDPIKYAKYYLFLEDAVAYYNDYQMQQLKLRNSALTTENTTLTAANYKYGDVITEMFAKLNAIENGNKQLIEDSKESKAVNKQLIDKAEKAEVARDQIVKKLDTVVNMLKEKSIVSTMNPADPKFHHHFVAMGYSFKEKENGRKGYKLALISGQNAYVRGAMRKKLDDENHNWTEQIGMHYNANGIDLRVNIQTRVNTHLNMIVEKENARLKQIADQHNKTLRNEITAHNKRNPKAKRNYNNEKMVAKRFYRYEIPITCNKTSLSYIENDWLPYDDLIELIRQVNVDTQTSPYGSDNESD